MLVNSHAALGETVRAARLRLGLSQVDLATNSGMSRQSLVALERGTGNPTWDTVLRVTAVLGLELDLSTGAPNAVPIKKASSVHRPPVDLQALLARHTET
jgi:transcriptional regulator with XRE-family HTH domain